MARTPLTVEQRAVLSVTQFADKANKRNRKRRFEVSKAQQDKLRREMDVAVDKCDWTGCTGRHLVALYGWMHESVYGVAPLDLGVAKTYAVAGAMAQRMVDGWFGGSVAEAADFMAWTWQREQGRMKWRAENLKGEQPAFRLSWRLQFGPALVTDYRTHLATHRKKVS